MKKKELQPYIPELIDLLRKGRVTRREFIYYATLLGLSAGIASQIAGLSWPKPAIAAAIKRGGTLNISASVFKIIHPAQSSRVFVFNQLRQVAEYLTFTDSDNITHPYLLENWVVSKDLKTWTLNLRRGIKFNNGDEFTADDVIFTMNEWLKKEVGSTLYGMVGAYLSPSGIEKLSKFQVKLHLRRPEIAVPEHLFHYQALILNHRTFEGDFIKAPHGTGPYILETYRVGEICVLKRRNDYWQKGDDGKPLPYLDGMKFISMGEEMASRMAALQAGEIDMIDMASWAAGSDVYAAMKDDPRFNIIPVATAKTRLIRMRSDLKPWSDNRVRMALKLCQQREKMMSLAYAGQGVLGGDFHVYPKHPEYCVKPIPKYDPQKAKELLTQAGYPNGIDVKITVGSGWSDIVRMAEILKQDAAPAGFRITIETVTTAMYLERWTDVSLGITNWAHRALGTMNLNLAYSVDTEGNPVSWNETRWVDEEFNKLLQEANQTLDVEARRKIFCKLEDIQMTRGTVGIPYWLNTWSVTRKAVMNVIPHPSEFMLFNQVWLKGEA